MHSRIVGTGSYLPAQVLTNAELAQRVDTSDEWIRTRTGIRQRHLAAPGETTSDLALAAAREALTAASLAPAAVDMIVLATTTPDMVFPSTACILQDKLGTRNGPAFDVQAVCSGFVYALGLADLMVNSGQATALARWCWLLQPNRAFCRPICSPTATIGISSPYPERSRTAR